MTKIPCVVLVYFDFDVIRTAIEALLPHRDRLSLIVVENRSSSTDTHIRPFIEQLVRDGTVETYLLFDRNISNNVFECVIDGGHVDLTASPYVMFTDGDLLPQDDGWLTEEIQILERHPDVFACGVTLSTENLPLAVYPASAAWAPGGVPREDYVEDGSGLNLLLMRTRDLRAFLAYRREHGVRFLDFEVSRFARDIAGMKWARTKRATARHLTWDSYADVNHPYTRLKLQQSYEETWAHDRFCGYRVLTSEGATRRLPVAKIVRGWLATARMRLRRMRHGPSRAYEAWDWRGKAGK